MVSAGGGGGPRRLGPPHPRPDAGPERPARWRYRLHRLQREPVVEQRAEANAQLPFAHLDKRPLLRYTERDQQGPPATSDQDLEPLRPDVLDGFRHDDLPRDGHSPALTCQHRGSAARPPPPPPPAAAPPGRTRRPARTSG